MVSPLGVLAAHFDRIGQYEAAATIVGFAATAFALATFPEITATIAHLREVLGDNIYESLAHNGEKMTNSMHLSRSTEHGRNFCPTEKTHKPPTRRACGGLCVCSR
jgi:hypothetical protein